MSLRFFVIICLCFGLAASANPTLLSTATSEIFAAENFNTNSLGVLTFKQYREQSANGEAVLYVEISGNLKDILPAGLHGFHVHEKAPVVPTGCTALGPHYNPFGKEHSSPGDINRHVGDLGNINADTQGNAAVNVRDSVVQIGTGDAKFDVLGKSFAIHVGTDDLGVGGTNVSKITGNAGRIMACGVILKQGTNFAADPTFKVNYPILLTLLEVFFLGAALM